MNFSLILPILVKYISEQAENLVVEISKNYNLEVVELREFFIEDRLEKFRLEAFCNLGESGIRNISLGELLDRLDLDIDCLKEISLADSANQGSISLRRHIATLYGNNVSEENVLVTTGTSEALFLFFSIFVKSNTSLSLLYPAFQALYEVPMQMGAQIRYVDVTSNDWKLSDLWSTKPDIIVLNHPHNPTGIGLSPENWNELKETLPKLHSRILFDEHYRFLDFESDLTRSGFLLGENCYATGSITKCFGVVGLKIGWILGDKNFIQKARSFKDYLTHTVNPLSEYLCEQILIHREKLIAPVKTAVKDNIDFFSQYCEQIFGYESFDPPQGGLVGFVKLQEGIMSEEYADSLYADTSVFVLPGANFEKEGYIRIGFGETNKRFREGVMRWVSWAGF